MCFGLFKKKKTLPNPVPIGQAPVLPVLLGEPESLHDFATLADLEAWYDLHQELRMPEGNLCDDYAEETSILAEMDGYRVSDCLVYDGKVWGVEYYPRDPAKPDEQVFHVANSARVIEDHSLYLVDLAWAKLEKLLNFIPGGKF